MKTDDRDRYKGRTTLNGPAIASHRLAYVRPVLVRYGTMAELTKDSLGTETDGGAKQEAAPSGG